jgi:multidrug efflux pump
VQVQNRVALAQPQLPQVVTQKGLLVQKKSSNILMLVGVFGSDDRQTPEAIAQLCQLYVLDAIRRVPGAGEASIMGVPDQAVRVWLDADRMAARNITTADVKQAIAAAERPVVRRSDGPGTQRRQRAADLPGRHRQPVRNPSQYENIILRGGDGSAIVRLKDVARVEVGLKQYIADSQAQPPARHLHRRLSAARRQRPAGFRQRARRARGHEVALPRRAGLSDRARHHDFVRLSIEEVIKTLFEAIVLVVLVVYLFLQSLRATLICTVAIVVALVSAPSPACWRWASRSTCSPCSAWCWPSAWWSTTPSWWSRTSSATCAENHLSPKEATIRSMGEIGSAAGRRGAGDGVGVHSRRLPRRHHRPALQAVRHHHRHLGAISGFVALTLTPAMCATLLKHNPPPQRGFFAWFNRQVDRVTRGFGHAVEFVIKRMVIAFVLLGVFLYAIWHLFHVLPTSFVPQEDQGYAMVAIIMPQAASLERTQAVAEQADAILAKIPGVDKRSMVTGYSLIDNGFKTNAATFFVTFKDFRERYADLATAKEQNARAILTAFYDQAKHIREAIVLPIAPPAIPGIGTTGGFEFWIQDTAAGSPVELGINVQAFLAKARQTPELAGVNSTFNANSQQLRANVDREKAMLLNVPIQDVYSAVQAQFGSLTVSQFNQYSQVWWVVMQSDALFRQQPADLTRLYTRSNQNKMVPLSAVVSTEWTAGPDILPHFNGFPAAKIIGGPAAGYSSGQAIAAMEALGRELPPAYTFAWSGLAFEEKQSGGTSSLAFVFGLIIVFLVLAAQYESWTLPGAVMTAIPFGVLGALLVNHIRGLENDVYFQIGLLVLIGLGAKNAVLRVSAAVEFRQAGHSIMEATRLAGEQRLRPIIMTSLAFAVGVLPLALAVGAGANARHSIGTGIIGGMIGETTLAMLYVPLFFYIFDRWGERRKAKAEAKASAKAVQPAAGEET